MKAVFLLDQGWTVQKIDEALMIDEDTVNRHLHEYQENGKLKPENGGSKGKLGASQKAELVQQLDETLYVHARDILNLAEAVGFSHRIFGLTFPIDLLK
jgi:transposase